MKKIVFHLPQDKISDIGASANTAKRNSLTKEEIFRAELLLEETYLRLSKGMNAPNLSAVVTIKKRFGDISLEISARGEAANPIISQTEWIEDEADLASANILKAHRHLLGYSRWNGENVVSIKIHEGGGKQIFRMVAAMVLGVAFGLAMRTMVPAEVFLWIEANLSSLVTTMFMHALVMMVPLLIFCAIVSGITNMSETADLGKIGARFIGQSVSLAVGLGYLLFGENLSHLVVLFESGESGAGVFSLKEMLLGVVPDNLVDPFRGGNLTQVLFLAIFFGILLNSMGEKRLLPECDERCNPRDSVGRVLFHGGAGVPYGRLGVPRAGKNRFRQRHRRTALLRPVRSIHCRLREAVASAFPSEDDGLRSAAVCRFQFQRHFTADFEICHGKARHLGQPRVLFASARHPVPQSGHLLHSRASGHDDGEGLRFADGRRILPAADLFDDTDCFHGSGHSRSGINRHELGFCRRGAAGGGSHVFPVREPYCRYVQYRAQRVLQRLLLVAAGEKGRNVGRGRI